MQNVEFHFKKCDVSPDGDDLPITSDEFQKPMGTPFEIHSFPRTTDSLLSSFCSLTPEQNGRRKTKPRKEGCPILGHICVYKSVFALKSSGALMDEYLITNNCD